MSQRMGATARTAATLAATLIGSDVRASGSATMRTLRLFGVNQCMHLEKT
jgi:hypothetical protein